VLLELVATVFGGVLELLHFLVTGRARRKIGMSMNLVVGECFFCNFLAHFDYRSPNVDVVGDSLILLLLGRR
jgi:riboflavin transporter FmnP